MKGPIVVIKLGTSSIIDEKTHQPLLSTLGLIVETAVQLRKDEYRVIIVSSGAIGVGLRRMDMDKRPKNLTKIQALAAIGQCRLISLWDSLFAQLGQPIAQILLTRNDIENRRQYLNAKNTFSELLDMGIIPIVNENDTLAVSEIKFGDNDTLSAITAAMVRADFLFLMTDVDCLYDKNPRTHPDAQAIEVVEDIDALQVDVSSVGSALGTGGMSTKIVAARLATSAGVTTIITRSSNPGNIANIVRYIQSLRPRSGTPESHSLTPIPSDKVQIPHSVQFPIDKPATTLVSPISSPAAELNSIGAPLHTRFVASLQPIRDRYFWLLYGLSPNGSVYIDSGAQHALASKSGLLPAGVVDVSGSFAQHEAVRLMVVNRIPVSLEPKLRASPLWDGAGNSTGENRSRNDNSVKLWDGTPVEVGRALVNYSASEISRIKGCQSTEIPLILGYSDSDYVAVSNNISFFRRESRPATPNVEESTCKLSAEAHGSTEKL